METPKTLVIGLDGVPFALLETLYAKDLMPFLQSLQARGYSASLKSTVPPMSPTAWTTLATGANPGQHGVLHFVDLRPGKALRDGSAQWVLPDCPTLLNANEIKGITLWQLLSDAEVQQVVVNVPLTYPPRPVNGIMVTGMMTPPHAEVFTHPPELSEQLRRSGYEVELDVDEKDFEIDHKHLAARLHQLLSKRTETCLRFMEDKPWDFFMVVFTGTDRAQHHCWKYLVPGSPEYDSPAASEVRPLLERYFVKLDQAIESLVTKAGPEARVLILSDHGFGPIHDRTVYTLSLMEALGLAGSLSKSPIVRFRKLIEGSLGLTPGQLRRWAKRLLPARWAAKLDMRFRDAQLSAGARGPVFVTPMHSYIGGVYINREIIGEQEAPDWRRRLAMAIEQLSDPETGARIVDKVYMREELYSGESIEDCPDVVFYLIPGYGLADGVGPNGHLIGPRRRHLKQQGVHRDEGILLLSGPGVRSERGPQQQLIDVTATLLYMLKVPIPATMESHVITDAFEPTLVEQHAPVYGQTPSGEAKKAASATQELSPEDQEQLMARLRGLGYIE